MDLEKKEYKPIEVEDVKEISSTQREKMLQKSAKYLPDNPADSGMRASAVKPKFYGFVTDSSDSMIAYHNETVRVLNERLKSIKEKVNSEFGQNATDINDIIDEITLIYKALEVEVANRNAAIEQAISNLVNNSPEALDTLHELAQALGNDPNFATTIINLVNEKYTSSKQYADIIVGIEASDRQTQDNNTLSASKAYTNEKITEEVANRNTAISNAVSDEASARQQADSALSQRIDNILGTGGDISTIEGAYDKACQYANNLVTNLINNSPQALDTLYELAQALGNDPNFATTITNLISTKYNEAIAYADKKYSPTNLPNKVKDKYNNAETFLAYSKEILAKDVTYLGAWIGYELRAIHRNQFVCTSVGQGLSDSEKTMARNNIGAMPYISINGGLMAESSSSDWGVNIGTQVAGWNDTSGGSFKFRKDCPNAGQMSLVIDGTVYMNEGHDRAYCASYLPQSVKDINDGSETTFAYSKPGIPINNVTWIAAWNGFELRAVHKDEVLDYHLLKNKPTLHYVNIANQNDDVNIHLLIPDYGDNGIAAIEDVLNYLETIGDAYIMCSGYGNQGNDIYVGIHCFGDGKVRLNTASGQIRTFNRSGFEESVLEYSSIVLNY